MQPSPPDYHLIARALEGRGSAAERDRLERWLSEHPENRAVYRVIEKAWAVAAEAEPEANFDASADWSSVRARLEAIEQAPATPARAAEKQGVTLTLKRRVGTRRQLIAATVAALLILPLAGLLMIERGEKAARSGQLVEVVVPRGESRQVALPDGSTVQLAAGSTLRYENAGASQVELELEGLGYFDVVPDPERLFIVRSRDGLETRVLGTRFVVRAYAESPEVEVAVAEGRVQFGRAASASDVTAGEAVEIGPGEVGSARGRGSPQVEVAADLDGYFGWTRGRLVIADRPLAEALVDLSRWYDAELKVEDPALAARLISTTAGGSVPLDDVIAGIVLALDAGYEARGDTLVLIP